MKARYFVMFLICILTIAGCYPDESVEAPVKEVDESDDAIDQYIQEKFIDDYGIAVRYKFVDRYVELNKRVTAPERKAVIPMLDFLTSFWIEPFVQVPNGKRFFESHVPAEVVFIGSSMFNDDGTITLGTADAGARITLTEVNLVDTTNTEWILRQLGTIYHEFAHIVHQRYNLPPTWQEITPSGYTSSGSWFTLSDEEALRRGFVSPYGTSSFNEDFAELVAFLLFDEDFYTRYLIDESNCITTDCAERNAGRAKLRVKYNAVLKHYESYTGVDLLQVREIVQEKLKQ